MKQKNTVGIIGGDSRMLYAARRFAALGYTVTLAGMELAETDAAPAGRGSLYGALQADTLLFGLPMTKDGETVHAPFSREPISIAAFLPYLHPGHAVYAGMPSPAVKAEIEETGAAVFDYFTDDALTLYNAMLSAEALTGLLIQKLPCAVFGAKIAITGYGRIGFYLARMLDTLGADVTVFARSPLQLAKARTVGLNAQPLCSFNEREHGFRALVNTVPARILDREALTKLNRNCLLLEAASAPYGIDSAAAAALGIPYYLASGLPGKYAPESAGVFIADTVINRLREVTTDASP